MRYLKAVSLPDVLFTIGYGAFLHGVRQVYIPAMWIIGGAGLVVLSFMLAAGKPAAASQANAAHGTNPLPGHGFKTTLPGR